jgi:ribokinase
MTSSPQVIIVGSYVQDQAWFVERFPRPGETMRANRYNTGPGGKGFNQAVACARQGVPTAFIGALGRDTFAEYAKRFASDENMPCRWQIRDDQPTSTSSITVNAKAENQISMIFGANEHLDPDFVRAQDDLFAGAKTLLLQLENNLDALAAALEVAGRHRLTRILNPAPVHADLTLAMLQSATIITPNETEFSLLLERFTKKDVDPARGAPGRPPPNR